MKKVDINALIIRWLQVGTINEEQAQYMRADVQQLTSQESGKRFISGVMLIGAFALSLGVLLVIASNWSAFGQGFKALLAVLMPIIPISFAYYRLEVKGSNEVLGRASGIVGLALVGGALALIAQIYNLEPDYVRFLWLWMLLTAPLLLVFKRAENAVFSATLGGVALLATLIDWFEIWDDEQSATITITLAALLYAFLLFQIGNFTRYSKTWMESGQALRLGSASLAIITLFITTFEFYARVILDAGYRSSDATWVPLSIILNLVFLGFLLYVMLRAFRYEENKLGFNIIRIFGIYLLVKYVTLFSGMLDTGLFMILGGLMFIAGAWYLEKKKDLLVSYMRQEVGPKVEPSNYGE